MCYHKVERMLLDLDGLQLRLDSIASQLSGARNSSTAVSERLEQHHGRLVTSQLQLESLPGSSASSFVDRVDCLVCDEVPAHRVRFTNVVASACDSMKMDSRSILELLRAAEPKIRVSTADQETLGTPSSRPQVPGNNLNVGQPCVFVVERNRP